MIELCIDLSSSANSKLLGQVVGKTERIRQLEAALAEAQRAAPQLRPADYGYATGSSPLAADVRRMVADGSPADSVALAIGQHESQV